MRPINLIPSDERQGKATSISTGAIAYLLVGALALALAGVTLVVLTGNKASDRKAEITELEAQETEAQARADQYTPFIDFANLESSRTATVKNLADSRFDWERVMRELALVIPGDVWLTNLTGVAGSTDPTAAASASTSGGANAPTGVPSLTLKGCAAGQEGVAGFLAALRDIDGVTRVGLSSSERSTQESTTSGGPAPADEGGGGSEDCRTRDFIAQFEIVVAFDAVPPPAVPGAAPVAPAAAPPTATAPATEATPAANTGT